LQPQAVPRSLGFHSWAMSHQMRPDTPGENLSRIRTPYFRATSVLVRPCWTTDKTMTRDFDIPLSEVGTMS
jgi:hypothetical protein